MCGCVCVTVGGFYTHRIHEVFKMCKSSFQNKNRFYLRFFIRARKDTESWIKKMFFVQTRLLEERLPCIHVCLFVFICLCIFHFRGEAVYSILCRLHLKFLWLHILRFNWWNDIFLKTIYKAIPPNYQSGKKWVVLNSLDEYHSFQSDIISINIVIILKKWNPFNCIFNLCLITNFLEYTWLGIFLTFRIISSVILGNLSGIRAFETDFLSTLLYRTQPHGLFPSLTSCPRCARAISLLSTPCMHGQPLTCTHGFGRHKGRVRLSDEYHK